MELYNYLADVIKKENTKINHIITIFAILDIIATILIGLFTIFAPNLNITIFKKEPTMVVLILVVLVMITLSLRPLIRKTTVVLIRLFIGLFLTIFLSYAIFLFIKWYIFNIEGVFTFRFLSFSKKASLENKLELFNLLVYQMVDIIRQTKPQLADFLIKSPSIIQPSTFSLMNTPYKAIQEFAENSITTEKQNYQRMLDKLNASTEVVQTTSDISYYIKGALIVTAVVVVGVLIYYYAPDSLTSAFKKTTVNLASTQDQLVKTTSRLAVDAAASVGVNQDMITITNVVSSLKETNLAQQIQIDRLSHLMNKTVRPIVQ
jgi:hypothetical protein